MDPSKDHELIERYLQDQLSPADRAAFEERCLSSPELLDQLEAAELLRQGLRDLARLEPVARTRRPSAPVLRWLGSPQYALAASFLFLASLGVSGFLYNQLRGQTVGGTALPVEVTSFVSVRGAADDRPVNRITLGREPRQYVVLLEPGYTAYSHFRARVFAADAGPGAAPVWQADRLRPGYAEFLALSLPSTVLRPGEYEIRLEGWNDDWPQDHGFDAVDSLRFEALPAD